MLQKLAKVLTRLKYQNEVEQGVSRVRRTPILMPGVFNTRHQHSAFTPGIAFGRNAIAFFDTRLPSHVSFKQKLCHKTAA